MSGMLHAGVEKKVKRFFGVLEVVVLVKVMQPIRDGEGGDEGTRGGWQVLASMVRVVMRVAWRIVGRG